MTDRHDEDWEDEAEESVAPPPRSTGAPEGVRILGAEEARAAMDSGGVTRRRSEQDPRYGDVPPRPDPAIRPSARFPRPADEPLPEIEPRHDEPLGAPAARDVDEPTEVTPAVPVDETDELGEPEEGVRPLVASEPDELVRPIPVVESDEPEDEGAERFTPQSGFTFGEVEPDEPIAVDTGDAEPPALPHWSEPPTGEMPIILPESEQLDLTGEEDLTAFEAAAGAQTPRFRTGVGDDWADDDFAPIEDLAAAADEPAVAIAGETFEDDDTAFHREVQARRRIGSRPRAGAVTDEPPAEPAARTRPTRPRRPPAEDVGDHMAAPPDMWTRVITGVAIVVLALICFQLGREATMLLATLVVGLATFELFQGLHGRGFRPATILAVVGSLAIVPIAFDRGEFAFPFVLAIVTVFSLLWYLLEVVHTRPVVNFATTVGGFVYVGVLGAFAGLLLSYADGVGLILGAVICVVAYDVFGYFVGSQFGKSRLAPAISPNKTIEGLIGGMTASIIVAVLVVAQITPWGDFWHALALGVVVAVLAPLGDLCESLLKRDLGIKDFGSLLPGHGGILDRFDALLFCLPATYYLALGLGIIHT